MTLCNRLKPKISLETLGHIWDNKSLLSLALAGKTDSFLPFIFNLIPPHVELISQAHVITTPNGSPLIQLGCS